MLKYTFFAAIFFRVGAFAPNKGNPFLRKTNIFSSANKNTPGDDSFGFFDDEDINRILRNQDESFQFIFDIDDEMKPEDVHIILFNPDTDREGVHTIEFPKDSGHNMILAFESRQECEQFSLSLKEQQFYDPTPQEMKLEFLENYCEQIGVEIQVVPEGMKLKPPTDNVLNLGLNPNLKEEMKMLDYLYQISGSSESMDDNIDEIHSLDTGDDVEGAWE